MSMRFAVLLFLLATTSSRADGVALPNPKLTPGAVDGRVTLHTVCTGKTKERRRVPPGRCDAVFRTYGVPDTPIARYSYECDHLVPLAIGGSNSAANLWPQPNLEAARKDRCEKAAKDRVCSGAVTLEHEQELFRREDWRTACREIEGAKR